MTEINLESFRALKYIDYIDEVVIEYAIGLKNEDMTLRIKVFKDKDGKYYARKNYYIGTKPQSPYASIDGIHTTAEKALEEAIGTVSMQCFDCNEIDKRKQIIYPNEKY
ncbi:MAG: hypothetical protein NTY74_01660 [Ignavibacteriae bacterium]|nr:hypothetical protein [Ignavibacteriota bacterium]